MDNILFEKIQKDFKMSCIRDWEGSTEKIRQYATEVATYLSKYNVEALLKQNLEDFKNGELTKDGFVFLEHYFGVLALNMVYYYGNRGLVNDDLLQAAMITIYQTLQKAENVEGDVILHMADKIYKAYKAGFKQMTKGFDYPEELSPYFDKAEAYVRNARKKNNKFPSIKELSNVLDLPEDKTALVLNACEDFILDDFNAKDWKDNLSATILEERDFTVDPLPLMSKFVGRREQIGVLLFRFGRLGSEVRSIEETCDMLDIDEKYLKKVEMKTLYLYNKNAK